MASLLASLMGGSTNAPVAATVDAAESSRDDGETSGQRSRRVSERSVMSLAGGIDEQQAHESADEATEPPVAGVSESKSNGEMVEKAVEQFVQKHVALQHRITFLEKENAQLSTINLDLCEELSAVETKVEDMQILKSNAEKKLDDEKKAHEGTKKKLDSAMKDLEHFRTDSDRSNSSIKQLSTFLFAQEAVVQPPAVIQRKRVVANGNVDPLVPVKKRIVGAGRPADAKSAVTWRLSAIDTNAPTSLALPSEVMMPEGINLASAALNSIGFLNKNNDVKCYRRENQNQDFVVQSILKANSNSPFAVQMISRSSNLIAIASTTGETSTVDILSAFNATAIFRRFTSGHLWSVKLFDTGFLLWWNHRITVTTVDEVTLARKEVFDSSVHRKNNVPLPVLDGYYVVCASGLVYYAMQASRGFKNSMLFSVDAKTGQRYGYKNPVRHGRLFANKDGTQIAVVDENILKIYDFVELPTIDEQAMLPVAPEATVDAVEALKYKARIVENREHNLNGINIDTLRLLKDAVFYVDASDTKLHRVGKDSAESFDAGTKIMDYLVVEVDGNAPQAVIFLASGESKVATFA